MISLVPVSGRREGFVSGTLSFRGAVPSIIGPQPYAEVLERVYADTSTGDRLVIVDVDGLRSRTLNTDLVKSRRLRGRETLFVSHIANDGDILDAMCGSFDGICVPYHTASDDVLDESLDLLEVPRAAVFVSKGAEISTGDSAESVALGLFDMGFVEVLMIDVDQCTGELRSY